MLFYTVVEYAQVMIKIKHPYIIQFFGIALVAFSIVFAGISLGQASAIEQGCYLQGPAGGFTPIECVNGDPSPKCEVTLSSRSGPANTEVVDCDTLVEPTRNQDEPEESEFKVSLNGEATLDSENYCGKGTKQVRISFDIGCLGNAYDGGELNPVLDMLFALLRFVSAGVGLIVIGSIIWAGIQYSTSRGNPQSTEAAIKRVTNAVIALLLYLFSFAILNFLVPGGLFVG